MQSYKVLIVDDEYWVKIMLQEVLINSGFTVFTASDHVEAVEVVKNDQPDIVILDVNLLDIDGISLLSRLKSIKSDIKAVFISGSSDAGCIEMAKAHGALGFFIKPFDILEFATFLIEISTSGMTSRGEGKWEMNGGTVQ
ncbi:MAG: response regulator [Tepidanaerobacter acetatoxydans]|uniref:response regulator n=1 Tax=Tepidanaerobacter TaxID=499228 RepID=UPI000A58F323|nr:MULTISPECIES: response regulator [Tepidanaerobacter]NLU10948.1 response regulator [Tepidanaerobacter acetatoxydans]